MISSRSALVLISCLSCLGFVRSAAGEQLNDYSTAISNQPVVETTTNSLFVGSSTAIIIAQASSPKPSETPSLDQLLPELNLNKETPTAKPTKAPQASKSKYNLPLWWIGSGAILVVMAGGLLYLLRNSGAETESAILKASSDSDSIEGDQQQRVSSDLAESNSHNHHGNISEEGNSSRISPFVEMGYPEVSTPPPQVNINGDRDQMLPVAENKYPEESTSPPPGNINNDGRDVSPAKKNKRFFRFRRQVEKNSNSDHHDLPPIAENIQSSELMPPPQSEALEVQETTRLAKINIVDELVKELQNPDPTKRRKAIWELAQRGDSRAIQPLVDSLIDADSKQRSLILEALSQIGNRTLKPMNRALTILLEDDNAEVRKNAIRDMTRIYDMMAQMSQLLRHAVDDPDAEVQETARWALTQLSRIRGLSGADNFSPRSNYKNPPEN